jgi:hypothetical protein
MLTRYDFLFGCSLLETLSGFLKSSVPWPYLEVLHFFEKSVFERLNPDADFEVTSAYDSKARSV